MRSMPAALRWRFPSHPLGGARGGAVAEVHQQAARLAARAAAPFFILRPSGLLPLIQVRLQPRPRLLVVGRTWREGRRFPVPLQTGRTVQLQPPFPPALELALCSCLSRASPPRRLCNTLRNPRARTLLLQRHQHGRHLPLQPQPVLTPLPAVS